MGRTEDVGRSEVGAEVEAPAEGDGGGAAVAVRKPGITARVFRRPELAAVVGALLAWLLFAVLARGSGFASMAGAANYGVVSAQLGLVAVPVALLMISGEFDLSVGSMVAASGMMLAIPVTVFNWPLSLGVLAALALAVVVGLTNGFVVMKTGLPSFIVTLAGLFALRGLTLGLTRLVTGSTLVGGVAQATADSPIQWLFASRIGPFRIVIFWWILITIIATWVLVRTRFGNWIYGTGGSKDAARNTGVPVYRVKIILFVVTACAAALLGIIQTLTSGSADTLRGQLLEFEAIIAAVIGGCLLTGGYGSAIGAFFGALTFGIVSQGIFFAGFNSDWFLAFLGVVLLIAVFANNAVREQALRSR